jgi:hypothetical protein
MNARRIPPGPPDDPSLAVPAATPPQAGGKTKTDNNARWDDDEEPWRHPPVAPNDESPADSLGRAVSDVVIGSADRTRGKAKP